MSSAGGVKRAAEAAPLFAPPGARLCTDTWITLGTPGVPKNPGKGYCFARFSSSPPRPKVASFDMDGTLVKTAHGGFPASPTDWTWNSEGVARVLRALHASGFELVVFSNQGGIKNAHTGKRAATSKGYFDAALKEAGVPISALMAPSSLGDADPYRKGSGNGMWTAFVKERYKGMPPPDLALSFFVGDAAGRPGDHGDGDRVFAAAVGLRFYLPEEAFGDAAWPPLLASPVPAAEGGGAAAAVEEDEGVIVLE